MKRTAFSLLVILVFSFTLFLSGCGRTPSEAEGRWAYIHDTEAEAFVLSYDKAVIDGTEYKVESIGEDYIVLSLDGREMSHRYEMNSAGMLLYKTTDYVLEGEDTAEGLVGRWFNAEKKWSFEFTEDGTFREDGYFPGQYIVDEQAGLFKLIYNDHFEDTVCYYSISGNVLTVEYPWQMVRMK